MFKVSIEKLLKNSGGQYKLLSMAFQRLHQLNNGVPPVIKVTSKKNVTMALAEISEGKVRLAQNGKENATTTQ
ncbi:MAG: DNA-directed RNA polymerase subunit omega [Candidatus Lindowbacteria bacterium]|nr:DNA-directed RNA polymerase subunit omega [Candidatus Lindowbacteria bacterium]